MNKKLVWGFACLMIGNAQAMEIILDEQLAEFKKACASKNFELGALHYYNASYLITKLLMDKNQNAELRNGLIKKFGQEVAEHHDFWQSISNHQKESLYQGAQDWVEQIMNPQKNKMQNLQPGAPALELPVGCHQNTPPTKWCFLQ